MFEIRRQHLRERLAGKACQVVLIDSPSNLYYYTGFTGGEAVFIMFTDCEEGYIITDSRYFEQVEKECPSIPLIHLEDDGLSATIKNVITDKRQGELLHIAVEKNMNLMLYLKLNEICKSYQFTVESELINEERAVKDEKELELLKKAETIGDEAFTYILGKIKPGVTEAEIALELEFVMKKRGASKLSFDTIVASGTNSSMPHAQVTNKVIKQGDFVTMDFGCVYKGYCSDMTRTVAVGQPTGEMKAVYQIVLDANLRAMEGIRAGVKCSEIDRLARDYIAEKGYGSYFGHGLGHSVGLDIHEEPRYSPKCDVVTKANMVITDEPGIYLPGKFGVRIEDLVLVKEDGAESFSHSDKQLIIL